MKKTINKDLYTQAEFARVSGKSRARINQMIKSGEIDSIHINGAILVTTKTVKKGGQNG